VRFFWGKRRAAPDKTAASLPEARLDNGWESSAGAWIADMGEHGDFARRWILDPVMIALALTRAPAEALDIGCGEGRFCRLLAEHGVRSVGVDPTGSLIAEARRRHPEGTYVDARAEQIPFPDARFDLVVSYNSLIDIEDHGAAIGEMARVLRPGGALLIANLTSFNTAGAERGWIKDAKGEPLHYPVDRYLEQRAFWTDYRGIRVRNYHRPLSAYMQALLGAGLSLAHFEEPEPLADAPAAKAARYRRAPWFWVMEWIKPA